MKRFLTPVLTVISFVAFGTNAEAKPLKGFILADDLGFEDARSMSSELVQTLSSTLEAHAQQTIRSKGDQALFGKSTQAMKAHWKVPDHRPLADFAPTIVLKAKDFATEITIFNVCHRVVRGAWLGAF